jgi:hypothetical protein
MTAVVNPVPRGPIRIHFEGLGTITLPGIDTLAFLGGVGLMAALGLVGWPLAALFALIRILTSISGNAMLNGLGDALALMVH